MKSGIRSIGLKAYATAKTHTALAKNGVSGCWRANQSITASRLTRLAHTLIVSKTDISVGSLHANVDGKDTSFRLLPLGIKSRIQEDAAIQVKLYLRQEPKNLPQINSEACLLSQRVSLRETRKSSDTPFRWQSLAWALHYFICWLRKADCPRRLPDKEQQTTLASSAVQAMRIPLGALGSAVGVVRVGDTGGTNISSSNACQLTGAFRLGRISTFIFVFDLLRRTKK